MYRCGRKTHPNVREWSAGHPISPGVVGRPTRKSKSVRKTHPDVRECSGDPPRCPGVVGRPTRMSGSGRRPFWMSGSGREAFSDAQEWSGVRP